MEDIAQMHEFLETLRGYSPTIPEEVVEYYLQQAGFSTNDPRILRLVALAAHKFLVDVTHDAMQYQRIRSQGSSSSSSAGSSATSASGLGATGSAAASGNRTVLTMEDLVASLKEYGVNIIKPEYFSDVAQDEH